MVGGETPSGDVFFFFQAEDGIRDLTVTGVQTCALPISHGKGVKRLKGGNMPAGFTRVIAVATLTAVLTLPLAAAQPSNPTRPASRVAQEPHPQIMAAIRALEAARLHLQRAAHDFGGHRVKAIRAIDAALVQLKLALQYDKD